MFVKNKAAEYFSRGSLSVYLETGFDGETGVKSMKNCSANWPKEPLPFMKNIPNK